MNGPSAQALAAINKRLKERSADTGQGSLGDWPMANDHPKAEFDCFITGLAIKWDAKYKYGAREGGGEVEAVLAQFIFEWISPDGKKQKFKGVPMVIAYDLDAVPAKIDGKDQRWRSESDYDRLLGYLQGITGAESQDIVTDLQVIEKQVADRIANNSPFLAKIYTEWNNEKWKDKKTGEEKSAWRCCDYCRGLISA